MSKKIAIAGYGIEGQSAYAYFRHLSDDITVFDEQPVLVPDGVKTVIGKDVFSKMFGYDIVVRSPGIHLDRIKTDGELTSVTIEFFKRCPAPIIGVTGSKGKGTTSTLIYKMLVEAGVKAHLVGNIGLAALDELAQIQPTDVVVDELASFQLWDLKQSPHIGVVVMMEPEHQDMYASVDEYVESKGSISAYQRPEDITIYLATNPMSCQVALRGQGIKIPYTVAPGAHVEEDYIVMDGQKIIATNEIRIPGQHNIDNACAAVTAVWQYTQNIEAIANVLREFEGLEHRLRLVAEKGGVKYYDDSIATTPGSAIAALKAFQEPKVLILGGSEKGVSFSELAEEVNRQADKVRKVILIGQTGPRIREALRAAGVSNEHMFAFGGAPTMKDIVHHCAQEAQPGDIVILSPACASFGMFKNYKDRGEQFIAAVTSLG